MELKLKVEDIQTTTRGGKSIKFSGAWTGNALYTGNNFPEADVQVGKDVDCVIEEVKKKTGDGVWNAVKFPKYEQAAPAGTTSKGGWQSGRQEDVELKFASFAMSYSKDMYMSTPEATLDGMFSIADKIADKLMEIYLRLKG